MNSHWNSGEMKVPSRPAPPPPKSNDTWSSHFFASKGKHTNNNSAPKKKSPPPRPPPPKFSQSRSQPSPLVAGLFPKRSLSRPISEPTTNVNGCLIDWTSPPSSPTSTTRSSSDALSVNSFGSDSVTPSSGNASNVESGFEDDFDLFCAPPSRSADPWSPLPQPQPVKQSWISFSPKAPKKLSMPTIIRPKPERPKPPKILEKKIEMNALAEVFQNVQIAENVKEEEDEEWSSDSPPMPSGPPPALPAEYLSQLITKAQDAEAIPIQSQNLGTAVAMFDYTGATGDLSFRQGDRIHLLRRIDEHWYEASLRGQKGSAPANFLQLEKTDPYTVKALYAFTPETWEDLALQPGMEIRLLGRVNSEWLYGEAGSSRGQFPANYVDHVPADLPAMTS